MILVNLISSKKGNGSMEIIINVVLFFTGLFLGNWLAIGRDKRKEFYEIADKVHLALKRELDKLTANGPIYKGPKEEDLELLRRRIIFYKKKGLNQAIKNYKEVRSDKINVDGTGSVEVRDSKAIEEAIQTLQKYTSRRY